LPKLAKARTSVGEGNGSREEGREGRHAAPKKCRHVKQVLYKHVLKALELADVIFRLRNFLM